MLIGIMGYKGHGKDTLAQAILRHNPQYRVTHFADALKEMCKEIFGLTDYDVYDPIGKETHFPFGDYIELDHYLQEMSDYTGLILRYRELIANSPREVLQLVGTEYIRSVKDSYWVDSVGDFCYNNLDVLIPDSRYPNEIQKIKALGGMNVWVLRDDLPAPTDGHASENSVSPEDADYILHVKTGDFTAHEGFAQLLRDGGWSHA